MLFSKHQDPEAPIRVDGSFVNIFNLRPQQNTPHRGRRSSLSSSDDDQTLTGINSPKDICDIERTPIGVDHRNMRTNILSVDHNGNLYFEGVIDCNSQFTPRGELLAANVGIPKQIAPAGRFTVLLLPNGDLFYLMWEHDIADYTPLGRLPLVPDISIEQIEETTLPIYVDPVIFPKPIELVAGNTTLTDEAIEAVDVAMVTAWKQTLHTAASTGRFVQPVNVRIALRLFDGSLYAMTNPITVGSADTLAGYGRAVLPPIFSNGYIIGTEKARGGVNTYRLGITLNNIPAGMWQSVIKSIEVFVADEPEVLNGTIGTATYSEQTPAVLARLSIRPREEVMESISTTQMRCMVAKPIRSVDNGVPFTVRRSSQELQPVDTITPPLSKADAIAGAGAFLHVCVNGTVSTMHRNNPLAVADTTDTGTQIFAIKPLPAAGGAYTRSYLYLMTDSGITALTHDAKGRHTNCRPIAPYMVENPDAVVHAGNGVWALANCGMLLHLKGSAVEYVMSGINPRFSLAWDQRHNELWIVPALQATNEHVMVLCSLNRMGYTRRFDTTAPLVCRQASILQARPLTDGKIRLTDLAPTDTDLMPGAFDKDVEVPLAVRSGRSATRRKEIGLCKFNVRALPEQFTDGNTLTVKYALPLQMQPQHTSSTIGQGHPAFTTLCQTPVDYIYNEDHIYNLVFRRPATMRILPDWQERYRISGAGRFRRIHVE